MKKKKRKKKASYGTQGKKITNFIPGIDDATASANLMLDKANAAAMSDPTAMGINMGGQILGSLLSQQGAGFNLEEAGLAAFGQEGENRKVEAEGEEVMDGPTTGPQKIQGPSHDNGGVDMEVPFDTDIFSDRVVDESGKTMAERKEVRERKKKSIVEMLEKGGKHDAAKRNAYKRKLKQLESQEQKDLESQSQAGLLASLLQMPHSGNEDGEASVEPQAEPQQTEELPQENVVKPQNENSEGEIAANGLTGLMGAGVDLVNSFNKQKEGLNTLADLNFGETPEVSDEDIGATIQGQNAISQGRAEQSENRGQTSSSGDNFFSRLLSGDVDVNLPGMGDVMKLAGNVKGARDGIKSVEEARAGDSIHTNQYENVGEDALETYENMGADLEGMKASEKQRILRQTKAAKRNARANSRGVNQMRATDAIAEMQSAVAQNDLFSKIASQQMDIDNKKAATQMSASQAKAKGKQIARDLNDKDRHAYHTAKGAAKQNIAKAMQVTGKDLNDMKLNRQQIELLDMLSDHYTIKNGKIVAKNVKPGK